MSRSDTERDVEAIAQEEYSSISISQKMISATWGSILTSILGITSLLLNNFCVSSSFAMILMLAGGSYTSRCRSYPSTVTNARNKGSHAPPEHVQTTPPKPRCFGVLSGGILDRR